MKNIAVIGTGYVGLVTGTCFAETGNRVVCVDNNQLKIEQLKKGIIPIYEPQLDVLIEKNVKAQRLFFSTDLVQSVQAADIIFLALPTPPNEDGSADLSYVLKVAEDLGKIIKSYKIIIDKSTVPVGTADLVKGQIEKNCTVDVDVVSNPEFLREGVAVNDFLRPERVVIGTESPKAKQVLEQLYKPFIRQGNPIYFMDERSAELTKYAANAFLATKISFMNEVANFCELVGANVDMVRLGVGSDSRIGKRFLFAGIGYGGSCFPKDVKALVNAGLGRKFNFEILQAVLKVNAIQKTVLFEKILIHFRQFTQALKDKKFAIWGLAFKPDTDDIREAPALEIITKLLSHGASVQAFDPEAMENTKKVFGDTIEFAANEYAALKDADALIICTEWAEFRTPNFDLMKTLMKDKLIFDGRNLYELADMQVEGFQYYSIGRAQVVAN